ncbi:hypothetical protein GCM10011374_37140 [Kocuria dechangensis]|uniref:TrbL/VirB6 plasmid conjugal transfer protein n=1 Tax=Kocuria dechangensis TaxID=1176249 RepID=A0A917H6N8_9MICC|nr:hypothetical protein [Kocuria dechangensis]GGG69313.1 hypothetical protein GCM10011374_37140 [Kocuria dechangensis]
MDLLGDLAGSIAGDTVEQLILFMAGWLVEVFTTMLDFVGTWWLNIGAPEMGAGSATERVQSATTTFVGVAGIIGTAFAVLRIGRDHNRESAENLVMGLIRTVVVSGLAVSMVALSLAVTDEVAPWLVDTIAGDAANDGLGQAMGLDTLVGAGMALTTAGILLVLAPFALLGAVLNAALVIFSYGVAGALCGVLPIFAAASTTPKGQKSFDKAVGWLVAVILFKPAAAVLYGFGLALMNGIDGTGDEVGNKIITLLTGTVVIFSACLAMPALARVMVPAVSAGPRGMGAGGLAMLGGAVAVGALTAGVGTAAAGAAAAGAGTTSAGSAGAAGAAGAGAAGAGSAGAGGAAGADSGATGALGGTGGGFSGAGATGGAGAQSATGAQASGHGGGAGEGLPTAGGPGGAQTVEAISTGADPTSVPGTPTGGASGAETVQPTSTGAAPVSAPGSTSGGASGAETVQATTTGAAPTSAAGTTTGGPSGAENVQGPSGGGRGGPTGAEPVQSTSSSSSSVPAGGAGEVTGPAGAEPVAPTTGAGPTGHPAGAGSSASGAKKSFIDGQRLEYGLREVVRDSEQSIESGEDL